MLAIGDWVMRYYPAGKKCKLDSVWTGPSIYGGGHPRLDGGHSETPRRVGDFDTLPECEKGPPAEWGAVVDCGPSDELAELENLCGISPNVHLHCEPWGHINHEDINCDCQSSDRTAAYVHDLTINGRGPVHSPDAGVASNVPY